MRKVELESWKTTPLALFGAANFLVAGFCLFVLGDVVPGLLRSTNAIPLNQWGMKGFGVWFVCGLLALLVWPFVAMTQKCHEVLKKRFVG